MGRAILHRMTVMRGGGWTRTTDLKDMSLASYQLLYPALVKETTLSSLGDPNSKLSMVLYYP